MCEHPIVMTQAPQLMSAGIKRLEVLCVPCGETVMLTAEEGVLWLHDEAGSRILMYEMADGWSRTRVHGDTSIEGIVSFRTLPRSLVI